MIEELNTLIKSLKNKNQTTSKFFEQIKGEIIKDGFTDKVIDKIKNCFTITQYASLDKEQEKLLLNVINLSKNIAPITTDSKKTDPIISNSSKLNYWEKDSVLNNYSNYTPTKDIFQAVCDEIAKHYVEKGFKYSKSKPSLTYKDKNLKLIIGFSSSRSNTPGSHIALEILPSIFSLEIIKQNKSTISSKIAKGLILSHTSFFTHMNEINSDKKIVKQIYGDILELELKSESDKAFIENNYCNIWGIDEQKFKKIIDFIDSSIIPMIDIVKDSDKLIKFIESKPKFIYSYLKGENVNSDFIPFCNMKFPELKIEERLSK